MGENIGYMQDSIYTFFYENPVFTIKEFREKLNYKKSINSLNKLLRYHVDRGRIVKVKSGIYAYIPPSSEVIDYKVDTYLVASKLTEDSVIGYQSALGFWGCLHSIRNDCVYLTKRKLSKSHFDFQGIRYKGVSFPRELITRGAIEYGVRVENRLGVDIKVTSLERAFVDVLDRPYFGYDWEELYRSIGSIPYLKLEEVIEYALLLGKNITLAKVGFFLELFKDRWFVEEEYLEVLHRHIPKEPLYIDRGSNEEQKFIAKWNILVPKIIITKNWEEPNVDI